MATVVRTLLSLLVVGLALLLFNLDLYAQVSFASAVSYALDSEPTSVAAADVNGDSKVDLITAMFSANRVSVLTNTGIGGFVLASSPGIGNEPESVTAADVNGDGKIDLITANPGDYTYGNTLTVLTNNGSGGFVLASSPVVGNGPESVVAVDVNGDGWVDLICANSGDDTLSVLTNDGSGGFESADTYSVGYYPRSVTVADVNGDGKVDLISANAGDGTVSVLTNDGSGGFVTAGTYYAGTYPMSVTAADVNGDGKVDLICANHNGNTLSVLTNDGSGGFVLASSPVVGNAPESVVAADVNGDGWVDLICANYFTNTLTVLTNNGNGGFVFAATLTVGNGPVSVTAADVNGDGRLDIICANASSDTLSVLINTATFTPSGSLRVNLTPPGVVSAGAQWQVDGGAWQNSGATVYRLSGGSHTVAFSTVTGWTTPTNQVVTINPNQTTTAMGLYVQQLGSLQVNLAPSDAVNAGAQWRVDGGAWQNSGATVAGLTLGSHTVTFNTINDWTTPISQTAVINNNQTATNLGTYTPLGSLQVNLAPPAAVSAGAQWQVDDGAWQSSGATVANLTLGNHTLSFLTVADWATPVNQTVAINSNQTTTAIGLYVQQSGSLQVIMSPAGAVTAGAQWQVDGGSWQNSGATVAGLTLGSHTVAFLMVPGWGVPDSQIVTVNANQTTAASAIYLAAHPATATAIMTNGFVVAVTIVDAGIGYTNTPLVYLVGGGGIGAQAIATVSNGVVTGITIINAGSGYTNAPIVAITPSFPLTLGIAHATCLAFTNVTAGTNYQLQLSQSGTWANLGSSFTVDAGNYTQYFDGTVDGSLYRLMALPIPYGATATPILAYGFVVFATVNDGGYGYVSIPAVQIIGGGGSGAQATATVSNGVVTAVNITNAGFGYTSQPTIQIDPPPVPALLPSVTLAFRLDYSGLTPALTYQLQASPNLAGWTNYGTNFTATDYTNSQYLNFGTGIQFFRMSKP